MRAMSKQIDALNRAIKLFPTQEAFAAALGVKSPSISEWRTRKQVPVERCVAIEAITNGAITRAELRPDIFGKPTKKAA
jgi:DNA-binding transcriptional regulator YdaS (Cro superfamily)